MSHTIRTTPPTVPAGQRSPRLRVLSTDLAAHVGSTVTIAGWIHRRRQLKSVSFAVVRDRAGLTQVVLPGPAANVLDDLPEETVVQADGLAVANAQAPGGVEITDATLTALSGPATAPPFDLYRPTVAAGLPGCR